MHYPPDGGTPDAQTPAGQPLEATVPVSSDQATGAMQTRASLVATFLLSASSAIGIVAAIVRQKGIAVVLGPAGIGLLGQLGTFLTLVVTLAGLGLSQSGIRSIAIAREEGPGALARTASVLIWASHALGVAGGLLVLVLPLESLIGADGVSYAPWLAVGVWATIASVGHTAHINGLGRLRELAAISAISAITATVVTLVAVRTSTPAAIIATLLTGPVVTLAATVWVGRGGMESIRVGIRHWRAPLAALLAVGVAFMGSALLGTGMNFVTRLLVARSLGTETAGLFHASWSIAGLYLTFLLGALSAEYYPRISALSTDSAALGRAVAAQARLVVHLVVPVVLVALVVAPLVVRVLYDDRFTPMLAMLRLQLVGDVTKVASWSLAFSLMATRQQAKFFIGEAAFAIVYTAAIAFVVPVVGLAAAGWAYFFCYVGYFALVSSFVRKTVPGLSQIYLLVAGYTAACGAVAWACASESTAVWAMGLVLAVVAAGVGVSGVWRQTGGRLDTLPLVGRIVRLRRSA